MFTEIEGATALLQSRGTFKFAPVYQLDRDLFVAYGTGYIRLRHDGSTSKDRVTWGMPQGFEFQPGLFGKAVLPKKVT